MTLDQGARIVEMFGYRDVQHQFIHDGDFISTPYDLQANTVEMYPFDQNLKEKIAYEEFRVELTPKIGGVKNSLILGGSYEHTSGTGGLASSTIGLVLGVRRTWRAARRPANSPAVAVSPAYPVGVKSTS